MGSRDSEPKQMDEPDKRQLHHQRQKRRCEEHRIYNGKYENYGLTSIDKVAAIGTTSHVIADALDIPIDIEFGVSEAAQSAVRKGLNVLILSIGDMSKNISKDLEDANVPYQVVDAKKTIKEI